MIIFILVFLYKYLQDNDNAKTLNYRIDSNVGCQGRTSKSGLELLVHKCEGEFLTTRLLL